LHIDGNTAIIIGIALGTVFQKDHLND